MALLQVYWFHSQSTCGRGELETLKCPCVTSVMNWLNIQGVSLLTAQDPSIPANLHKARFEKQFFPMQQACAFHCCSQVNVAASMQQFETSVLLNDKHSLCFLCSQLITGSKKSSKTLQSESEELYYKYVYTHKGFVLMTGASSAEESTDIM